jgi:hypothetical protein
MDLSLRFLFFLTDVGSIRYRRYHIVPLGGFEFGEKSMERKPTLQKGVDEIFPYFVPLPNLKREYNKKT